MYLSRLQLDLTRRSTMKALASPNLFHGAIEQSTPGPRERNLWRIDTLGNRTYLLILSQRKPELSGVSEQFGSLSDAESWETRAYEPLLNRVSNGSSWHFRLTANPTISKASASSERGKVLGHITTTYQKQWLIERAEKHGFQLEIEAFDVVQSRWLRFRKGTDGGRQVTLLSVTYEGILTITDEDLFRKTLTQGIGRGKAYGLGMLTIACEQR